MTTAIVMVTMTQRVAMLNEFCRKVVEHSPVDDPRLIVHVQGPGYEQWKQTFDPAGIPVDHLMRSPEGVGCHAARVQLLRAAPRYESYVNVDDDVVPTQWTNWRPAIEHADKPGNGFVLTNWVRNEKMLPAAVDRLADVFKPQIMVYQGGGMAYTEKIAELARALDDGPARYDDGWPLTSYLHGYRNWRYQGSVAVHFIMSKHGMKDYTHKEPRPLSSLKWVNYERRDGGRVGHDVNIPLDKHIKQVAIEQHHKARAEQGWPAHRGRA